jgi:hypothetical protein
MMMRRLGSLASALLAIGCSSVCAPSTPPRRGMIASCCGFGVQGYYWDGKACVPDEACECDGRASDPRWRTLEECQAVHQSCGR